MRVRLQTDYIQDRPTDDADDDDDDDDDVSDLREKPFPHACAMRRRRRRPTTAFQDSKVEGRDSVIWAVINEPRDACARARSTWRRGKHSEDRMDA